MGENFVEQRLSEEPPSSFWNGEFTEKHDFLFSKYLCAVPMTGPRYETGFDFKWVYDMFCKYRILFDESKHSTFTCFAHLHMAYMFGHLYPVEENIPRYLWTPLLGKKEIDTRLRSICIYTFSQVRRALTISTTTAVP
jgi:hypothetical protein